MKSKVLDDDILHVRRVIKEKHVNLVGKNEERKQLSEHIFLFCLFVCFVQPLNFYCVVPRLGPMEAADLFSFSEHSHLFVPLCAFVCLCVPLHG